MYSPLLFVGGLGGWEIVLIIAIILIFFGAKKLPELAKGLGTGIREFKSSVSEPVKKEMNEEPKQQAPQNKPVDEKETVVEEEREPKASVHP